MNGFHSRGRAISVHERTSTIGKKIANWIVGNSTRRTLRRHQAARGRPVGRLAGGMALGRAYRHWPARGVVLLLSLALWALAAPASRSRAISPAASRTPVATRADCGGVEEVYPARHPRGKLPPLAIGDSTMLLSLDELAGIGYDATANGCLPYPDALGSLRQSQAECTPP